MVLGRCSAPRRGLFHHNKMLATKIASLSESFKNTNALVQEALELLEKEAAERSAALEASQTLSVENSVDKIEFKEDRDEIDEAIANLEQDYCNAGESLSKVIQFELPRKRKRAHVVAEESNKKQKLQASEFET